MFRYYVSFSHDSATGFSISTADITMAQRVAGVEDVSKIRDYFARQGYTNIAILGFSLYAQPKQRDSR